jgi:hypothetical protein
MWKACRISPSSATSDAALPNLDVVGHWRDVARFLGSGRVLTAVADPAHLSDMVKPSIENRNVAADNIFTQPTSSDRWVSSSTSRATCLTRCGAR